MQPQVKTHDEPKIEDQKVSFRKLVNPVDELLKKAKVDEFHNDLSNLVDFTKSADDLKK